MSGKKGRKDNVGGHQISVWGWILFSRPAALVPLGGLNRAMGSFFMERPILAIWTLNPKRSPLRDELPSHNI